MFTGAWSDIHHIIRRQHRILIMLYHDQRISQILEIFQGSDQFIIVPLVQSDTRLIQNIGNSHQPRTDLRGKTDSLGLSAGQRTGSAGKAQIVQPYIH